ncbi:MAG: hypothetical protein ACPH6E_03215, partial [Candidatus Puniceispirillaceae bacterium]
MSEMSTSLKIAIAGLGVVGGEVARQLIKRQQPLALAAGRRLELVAVSARSAATDRGFSMDRIDWHDSPLELVARDDVDVIIEMIGGSEGVAVDLTRAALKNGKHVITPANIENYLDADYVARLRIVTLDELKTLGGSVPSNPGVSRQYWGLFPGIDFNYIEDQAVLVCECWVKRDRLDSRYNNWFAAWIIGEPSDVVRDMPNPWGGMTPYTPVKLTKMGKFLERTVVDDIVP